MDRDTGQHGGNLWQPGKKKAERPKIAMWWTIRMLSLVRESCSMSDKDHLLGPWYLLLTFFDNVRHRAKTGKKAWRNQCGKKQIHISSIHWHTYRFRNLGDIPGAIHDWHPDCTKEQQLFFTIFDQQSIDGLPQHLAHSSLKSTRRPLKSRHVRKALKACAERIRCNIIASSRSPKWPMITKRSWEWWMLRMFCPTRIGHRSKIGFLKEQKGNMYKTYTPPETNITYSLKVNGWKLEDDISFWNGPFSGDTLIFGGTCPLNGITCAHAAICSAPASY